MAGKKQLKKREVPERQPTRALPEKSLKISTERYHAERAALLVFQYVYSMYSEKEARIMLDEIQTITNTINSSNVYTDKIINEFNYARVQEMLSIMNEKESIRKSKGVYYTPNDVVRFILTNSVKALFEKLTAKNISDMELHGIPYKSFCFTKTIFDPTCGAGEYLLAALEMKLSLLKQHKKALQDEEIQKVVSTIHGNDVNLDSVIITKLRLLLCVAEICGIEHCSGLGNIMNRCFTTYDFVGATVQ